LAATPTGSVPAPPAREGGSLTWAPTSVDPAALLRAGWTVYSYHDLRERFIVSARSRGTARTSLENPAKPLLDLLTEPHWVSWRLE